MENSSIVSTTTALTSRQNYVPESTTISNFISSGVPATQTVGQLVIPIAENEVEEETHISGLHDYSNPKINTYFVGAYPTFIALVSLKFITEKYSPFDTHIPFMIISIVAYLMAILDLAILFCLYNRLKRPSHQQFSAGHYKILTFVFYILWILATLSVVPVLFTPQR